MVKANRLGIALPSSLANLRLFADIKTAFSQNPLTTPVQCAVQCPCNGRNKSVSMPTDFNQWVVPDSPGKCQWKYMPVQCRAMASMPLEVTLNQRVVGSS